MSDIHNLEIDVDLKENLIITATCKQLDDLNLIFNVWNNGEIANLTEYKCRLKAFKQDQIPLIQNTSININNNVVNIIADEQLTTTSGIVKVELQFISKNTGKKKSTFNIVFKVIQSVLEVERSISKATCTLLKEIDNKLDRIEDIGDVLEEAKDVRDTLINTTIPGATNINSKLESNIKNASDKIVEVESSITNASKKIEEVEASTKNANSSKEELDLSKTNADISKENLDAANVQAEKNIEELNKLGDVTDLAKNVQTNTTDITNLKEDVENNSSQLKDCAKQTDLDNYYSLVNATKIATGTDILTLPFGNYVSAESEITGTLVNCPTKGSGFVMKVERITGGIQGNFKRLTIKCNNRTSDTFINTLVDTQWSGWQQLATVDDTGWLDLPLLNGATTTSDKAIYRRIGKMVYFKGVVNNITTDNFIFGNLPIGFRPNSKSGGMNIPVPLFLPGEDIPSRLIVWQNGNLQLSKKNDKNTCYLDGVMFVLD
ncbi:hypothetical protein [Clostridium botulinum]|uniref:hypothetical protein n=1 Tax=Clostridium botulinum TaxID=1491 RepID=UPI000380706E|nr:hypothetical protein [Clostridium botulinum]